jgi:hypothetical protein
MNQNPIIQSTVTIYKEMAPPVLNHRRGSIISAILFVWLGMKLDSIFRPPENLRHIPYFGLFGVIRSIIKGERYTDSALRTSLPEINGSESRGIYIVSNNNILKCVYISDICLSLSITI